MFQVEAVAAHVLILYHVEGGTQYPAGVHGFYYRRGIYHRATGGVDQEEGVLEAIPSLKPLLKQRVARLSGGERKLLTLAMVMANRPRLLLYDEPLAGLSEDNIPSVLDLLGKLRTVGTTMLIVEHHVKEMMAFADKAYGMRLGRLSSKPLNGLEEIKEIML